MSMCLWKMGKIRAAKGPKNWTYWKERCRIRMRGEENVV
jgi:hypothetical protein